MWWELEDRDWRYTRMCEDVWCRDTQEEILWELNNTVQSLDTLDIKVPSARYMDGRWHCMNNYIGYHHWGEFPDWIQNVEHIQRIYFYRDCFRDRVCDMGETKLKIGLGLFYKDIGDIVENLLHITVHENISIKFYVGELWDRNRVYDTFVQDYGDELCEIAHSSGRYASVGVVVGCELLGDETFIWIQKP